MFNTLGVGGMSSPVTLSVTPHRRPTLVVKFELLRGLHLVGRVVLISEAEPKIDTMLTEDVPHCPAVNISESSGITKRDSFAFVEGNSGCNSFVLVVFKVLTNKFSKSIAFADEYTRFNGTFREEIQVVWIGAGYSCYLSI